MFLKQITLEGFKSYAKRVTLENFDPHFNAITGLNGTGKSNILDSICFVLGLTKMAKVRVQNLQGLIFKEGQSGISRASVSLLFDNSDPKTSPPGYESFKEISIARQVAIGGKTKYLINGCNAQPNRVQNLFQSIHLNINNPHFLIMQGRVAQVLNMSPKAILEMIEEVVGTRMYEFKKQNAKKVIDKKESKLLEINTILEKEIRPKLKKLEKEQEIFKEWQSIQTKLELANKAHAALDTISVHNKKNDLSSNILSIKESIETNENELVHVNEKIKSLNEEKTLKIKTGDKTSDKELGQQKIKVREMEEIIIKLETKIENLNEITKTTESLIANSNKNEKKEKEQVKQAQCKYTEVKNDFEKHKTEKETLEAKYKISQSKTNEETVLESLNNEIKVLEQEKLNVEPYLKTLEKDINSKRKEKETEESELKPIKQEYEKLNKDKVNRRDIIRNFKEQEEDLNNINHKQQRLKNEINKNEEELLKQVSIFPYKEFLKKKEKGLKGIVAELISIKNEKDSLAIETVAGARLNNIVVTDHIVSKMVLTSGGLTKRATMIPINKIKANPINKTEIQNLKSIMDDKNIRLASECLEFDKFYTKAIDYVFGRSIVCSSNRTAKNVAYTKNLRDHKVVTLEGDTYAPSGTVSGGFRNTRNNLLDKIQKINTLRDILCMKNKEYDAITSNKKNIENKLNGLRKEYEKCTENENRFIGLKSRFDVGIGVTNKEDIRNLEQNLQKYKEMFEELQTKLINLTTKRNEINSFKTNKLNKKELGKILNDKIKEVQKKEKDFIKVQIQLNSLKEKHEKSIVAQKRNKEEKTRIDNELDRLNNKLNTEKDELGKQKLIENKLFEKAEEIRINLEDNKNKKGKLEINRKQVEDNLQKLKKSLKENEKEFKLINEELNDIDGNVADLREFYEGFIKANPDCKKNLGEVVKKLEHSLEDLSTKVNKKVFVIQEKTTKEFKELIKKRDKVLRDKKKINAVLIELDKRKDEALVNAWKAVNRNFNSIFSTLLPGNSCELKTLQGKKIKEGLEIKVKLGNTWKESLSELSGGQKSLLALSLILSLLLFKPAPIYILDEIDAALDLTHTQNIGIMLKKHFSGSQFLIVSLKEGLFQNANVVFRTKFSEGVSAVVRSNNNK